MSWFYILILYIYIYIHGNKLWDCIEFSSPSKIVRVSITSITHGGKDVWEDKSSLSSGLLFPWFGICNAFRFEKRTLFAFHVLADVKGVHITSEIKRLHPCRHRNRSSMQETYTKYRSFHRSSSWFFIQEVLPGTFRQLWGRISFAPYCISFNSSDHDAPHHVPLANAWQKRKNFWRGSEEHVA